MRFAKMMTIGVLVGSAQIPCGYEVTAIIQAPAYPLFGPPTAFGEFLDLRVDGDNDSPTGDGSGWGLDAYKFLQDALADAADAPPDTTVRLWVAATDLSNPYHPDRDAAHPGGTGNRNSTFLLNFNNVQLLGGFPPGGGDLADRDPALYETVLGGVPPLQCGSRNAGNCLEPNGTPNCNHAKCCEAVCTEDPDCCVVAWDQACADLAFTVCGSCGDEGSGDCFVANGTPGCDDAACCSMVCLIDPSCCLTAWDQGCADLATQICDLCGQPDSGDCFENNGTPWCDDLCGGQDCPGCCELVCFARPECCNDQWDQACANLANIICGVCGEPDSGGCFEPNGTPGCENCDCCALVCAVRPECCDDEWDQACADFANIVCGVCGEPGSGSCFYPNGTPGCKNGNCCGLVCQQVPDCCEFEWDAFCVGLAIKFCDNPIEEEDPLPPVYHVVTVSFVDDSVLIDGFTITDGLADGNFENGVGGGMLILSASPAVVRVTFIENSAPGHGGGAMNISGASDPIVVNTSFIQNTGNEAGAIHTENGNPGGTFINCLFSGNASEVEGGALNPGGSGTLTLINCTLVDNLVVSAQGGGAIQVEGQPVNLINCILWGNLAGGVPNQISGSATVSYSLVQGGWAGIGNIDDDPLFVDPENGDYHLSPPSPCIDAAKNTVVPKGVITDLDENLRFIEDPNTMDTGLGDCPILDMGSYEFQEGTTDCCPWDIDHNGSVGASDLLALLVSWGPCKGCPADFDGNGSIGASDLLALLVNWGPCP